MKEEPACSMDKGEPEVCQQQGGKRMREKNSGHSASSWQVCPEVSLQGHREGQEGWIQSGLQTITSSEETKEDGIRLCFINMKLTCNLSKKWLPREQ